MTNLRTFYPTIVLSDVHIGSRYSRYRELTEFLKTVDCGRLILNGDIIDGWQLRKPGRKWEKEYTDFFKVLMKMMEVKGTEIIYVVGNHDACLEPIAPFSIANIKIVREFVHESHGKRYLVLHGDVYDTITSNFRFLAYLGDIGYTILLRLNHIYNAYRTKKGKPYRSLSQKIKHKVKSAVNYISDFEGELVRIARSKKMDGVICGHIHQAADTYYDEIHYLNSGDWVESMTALVEDEAGQWSVLDFSESKEKEDDAHTQLRILGRKAV